MGRTVPSPTWASNICFNWRWTTVCVSSLFVWNICTKVVDFMLTSQSFLSIHKVKSWGIPLRKHTSAQIMGFRCEGLSSCNFAANNCCYLHSLHQDCQVAVLQTAVSSDWNKLKRGKDLRDKSLSALWTIDSFALAARVNCQFIYIFFNQ